MRVYHFIEHKHGLENIQNRRLKVSSLETLNDPFELLAYAAKTQIERRIFREMKAGMGKKVGLICFSKTWSNPVQWSHYADRHRGLCLGFDVPDETVLPVRYVPKRLRYDPKLFEVRDEATLLHYLTTKFSHWRYEKEVRLIVPLNETLQEGSLNFWPLAEDLVLREIIAGDMCPLSREELEAAITNYDQPQTIALHKARLAFRSFNVVKQRSSKNW
ncbi:MAG: DUF2971 domain-containing protein [Janthinobacterium lividum]